MRNSKANQRMTLLTLVVALGAAIYLNWEYAKSTDLAQEVQSAAAPADGIVVDALSVEETDSEMNKNYGEAQLVSVGEATGTQFFEEARLSRTRTRDEALDKTQKALKKTKLSDEEKARLTKQLTDTMDHMAAENQIESLVKAKGFVDCVAFIHADQVNITVMTANDSLSREEVAQIRDIVLNQCKVTAQDITIVEVK